MAIEQVELWHGVEGEVLRKAHPDRVYPKLGVVVETGAERVSFDPDHLAPLHAAERKYGVLLFKKLTQAQKDQLRVHTEFYQWMNVPRRTNHTRVPHIDDSTGMAATSFFWPQGSFPSLTTGFSAVTPTLETIQAKLNLLKDGGMDPKLLEGIGRELNALSSDYYDRDLILSSSCIELIRYIRHQLAGADARKFFEEVNKGLAGVCVEAPWDYELGVYSENILHWGMQGEMEEGNVLVTSVFL